MNKKIFLTSIIALGFACPAMAEPTNTGEFPSGGLMQADYTYTNAATETNMGVYEGSVYANAQYEDVLYQLAAGKYLPANSETPIDCNQNGYYCAGDKNGVYYSSSAQGLSQCPNGYANSGTGASANTDCYRACATTDITHSTAITGNVYYNGIDGDGVKDCTPTACDHGYTPKAAVPNLMTVIGVSEASTGKGYRSISGKGNNTDGTIYGITNNGEFVLDYGNKGKIHGYAQCSTQIGSLGAMSNGTYPNITTSSTLPDSTGQYCYCHLDGYTANGSQTSIALSGPWVFLSDKDDASFCADVCASFCANYLDSDSYGLPFRAALFGTITPTSASCEANTITINWNGTSQAAIDANNAGTATYGSDVRTPQSATTVPGKRFTGWRFSTTAPSNGNE